MRTRNVSLVRLRSGLFVRHLDSCIIRVLPMASQAVEALNLGQANLLQKVIVAFHIMQLHRKLTNMIRKGQVRWLPKDDILGHAFVHCGSLQSVYGGCPEFR